MAPACVSCLSDTLTCTRAGALLILGQSRKCEGELLSLDFSQNARAPPCASALTTYSQVLANLVGQVAKRPHGRAQFP